MIYAIAGIKSCGINAVVVQSLSHVRLFVTPWTLALQAFPGISQARISEWDSLFQGIFPTQGLNLGLMRCWQILYH